MSTRPVTPIVEKSARMVQLRYQSGETGYSVIAECDYDPRGAEVGFYPYLSIARERGKVLKNDPTKWMNNQVGWIFIYDVSTCQIVEEVYSE